MSIESRVEQLVNEKPYIKEYREIQSVYKRNDGSTRWDHAVSTLEIMERIVELGLLDNGRDFEISPTFQEAILLHDIFDPMVRGENNGVISTMIPKISDPTCGEDDQIIVSRAEKVLATIEAAEQYELYAEDWRSHIIRAIGSSEGHNSKLIEEQLLDAGVTDDEMDEYRHLLSIIMHSGGKYSAAVVIPEKLWDFRSPMPDIDTMYDAIDNFERDGLFLKSAELIHNLYNPNIEKPISAWKDAQEAIRFYCPLLEIAGYGKLATELYSIALTTLNNRGRAIPPDYTTDIDSYILSDNSSIRRGIEVHSLSESIFNNIGEVIGEEELRDLLGDTRLRVYKRKKTLGSTIEKFRRVESTDATAVPDSLGFRIVKTNPMTTEEIVEDSIKVVTFLEEQVDSAIISAELNHTRQHEPAIQITYGDGKVSDDLIQRLGLTKTRVQGEFLLPNGKKILIKPKRTSGYSASHINFIVNGVGGEIQITDKRSDEINTNGEASHILYKARESFGEFGRLRRQYEHEPSQANTEKYLPYLERTVARLKQIRKLASRKYTNNKTIGPKTHGALYRRITQEIYII